ncbi:hypothetical protein I7044_004560 [Salmonella enterica subsp. enterica]|nr:hypothetical protein [Salmonella enterica]EGM1791496.1 hypothetical protein [Salmonella enterica subsp. enterica]EGR9490046.1 hypothetical protein [Salmonella enterica subsp. enterica]
MSINYKGIGQITENWEDLPYPGRFYTKGEITPENIEQKEFILFLSKEVEEYALEDGRSIPVQLSGQGYKSWLDSATVRGLIESEFEYSLDAKIQDIIKAIFYYLDNDAFLRE